MRREDFKVRAWIRGQNRMVYATIDEIARGVWSSPLSWCDLMRYTGVKDKNGNDVYEDDILKIVCHFSLRKDVVYLKVGEELPGCFGTDEWTLFELVENLRKGQQEFEVIGNIHQAPELLNN